VQLLSPYADDGTKNHEKTEWNRLLMLSLNDRILTAIINNIVIVIETIL
jgi:hypothetical protein